MKKNESLEKDVLYHLWTLPTHSFGISGKIFYCTRETLINSVIVFIPIIIQRLFPVVNFFFAANLMKLLIYYRWKNEIK